MEYKKHVLMMYILIDSFSQFNNFEIEISRSNIGDDFVTTGSCSKYDAHTISATTCKCIRNPFTKGTFLSNQNGVLKCYYSAAIATGCTLHFLQSEDIKYIEKIANPIRAYFTRNHVSILNNTDCSTLKIQKVDAWKGGYWVLHSNHNLKVYTDGGSNGGESYFMGYRFSPVVSQYEGQLFKITTYCGTAGVQECVLMKFKGSRKHQVVKRTVKTTMTTTLKPSTLSTTLKPSTLSTTLKPITITTTVLLKPTGSIPTITNFKPTTKTYMMILSTSSSKKTPSITSVVANTTIIPVTVAPTSNQNGAIVGSVIGTFLLILVILLAFGYFRRKKRQDGAQVQQHREIGDPEDKHTKVEHTRSKPNEYSVPDRPREEHEIYLSPVEVQQCPEFQIMKAKAKKTDSSSFKTIKQLYVVRKLKASMVRKSTKMVKEKSEKRIGPLATEFPNPCRTFDTDSSILNKSDLVNQIIEKENELPEKQKGVAVIPTEQAQVQVKPRIPRPYKKKVESVNEQVGGSTKINAEVDPLKDTPIKKSPETSVKHKHRKPKKTPEVKIKPIDETFELKTVPEIPAINVEKVDNNPGNEPFYDIPHGSVRFTKLNKIKDDTFYDWPNGSLRKPNQKNIQIDASFYDKPNSGSIKVANEKGPKKKKNKLKVKAKPKKGKTLSEPVYDVPNGTIGRSTAIPNLAYNNTISDDDSGWGDDFDNNSDVNNIDDDDDDAFVDINKCMQLKSIVEDKSENHTTTDHGRSKSEILPNNSSYQGLREYRKHSYEHLRGYKNS